MTRAPGTPFSAVPYPVRWALGAASSRPRLNSAAQRAWPRPLVRSGGFVVTLAIRHLPYGSSAHHGARYAHLVRFYWTAWRAGRPVGARARWWCGNICDTPALRLVDEPTRELCPMCLFTIARSVREET